MCIRDRYMMLYPQMRYIRDAIENSAMFFVKISEVLFVLTMPASSMAKPGAMNMTRAPITKKYSVSTEYAN